MTEQTKQQRTEQEELLRFILVCMASNYIEYSYVNFLELAAELDLVGISRADVMEAYRRLSHEMTKILWEIVEGQSISATSFNSKAILLSLIR